MKIYLVNQLSFHKKRDIIIKIIAKLLFNLLYNLFNTKLTKLGKDLNNVLTKNQI